MKKLLALTAALAAICAPSLAQVDYNTKTVTSFKTLTELNSDSGQTLTTVDGLIVNPANGNVLIQGRDATNVNYLVVYDASGTFLGVSGDLDAADDGDFRAQDALIIGTSLYQLDFGNETGDAIKEINFANLGAITLTELIDDAGLDGADSIFLAPGGNLAVTRGANNGGNSTLVEVTTGGVLTGNTAPLTLATGNDPRGLFLNDGSVVVIDGASGAIERIADPFGTPVSTDYSGTFSGYTPDSPHNILQGAESDDIIISDRGTPLSIIIFDGTNTVTIPFTDFSAGFSPRDRYGLAGYLDGSNVFSLYGADFSSGEVFKAEFGGMASVNSWDLYGN